MLRFQRRQLSLLVNRSVRIEFEEGGSFVFLPVATYNRQISGRRG